MPVLGEPSVPTVILVDKKTHTLKLSNYIDHTYRLIREFHATTGQVKGDKRDEGDLKTPEGIYFFTNKLQPPHLKPKFGVLAFYMDYPNIYDRMAGGTGFDIMLHATDDPSRLQRNYDSEGCVVVSNEDLRQIEPHIRLQLTPILVFEDLMSEYLNPRGDGRLPGFFEEWIQAWESKNIEQYISFYHTDFHGKGMNRQGWQDYKGRLNQQYHQIRVNPKQVQFLRHPKYSVIVFGQNYRSTRKDGKSAFVSEGTKIIYVAEEKGELKILSEDFSERMW